MWYRTAQNKFNYNITQEGNLLKISLKSALTSNGLPEYPTVNIYQSLPGGDSKLQTESKSKLTLETFKNLVQSQINEIFSTVMNVFALYPKGALNTIASKGLDINVGKEGGGTVLTNIGINKNLPWAGLYEPTSDKIFINFDYIMSSLNHEIGHAIDKSTRLDRSNQDMKKYQRMAPTGYAKTNKFEAFAEGYEILSLMGFEYRFPETSEQNIRQNQLLDIVRQEVKKNPSSFKDFGSDIKFDSLKQKGQLSKSDTTTNLKSRRLSTLVGAFQNAVDKYSGDKNEYAKNLINNQQKIDDIVGFLNKNEYFFSIEPVTQDELELALYRFSLSLDKTKDPSSFNYKNFTFKDREKISPINQLINNFYLPKNIKDFIDQHLDIYESSIGQKVMEWMKYDGMPFHFTPDNKEFRYFKNKLIPEAVRYFMSAGFPNKSDLQTIPQVSLLNEMVPANQYEYEIGQKIINAISTKNSKYIDDQANIDRIYQMLIKSIFPPLTFNNPEDFFLYDFQISQTSKPTYQGMHSPIQMASTAYTLDPNIVKQKINQTLDQDNFTKNSLENVKQKIVNDLYIRVMSMKEKYEKLIQNNTKLKITFQSAIKAIDKLMASNIKIKGPIFMRIYNLNEWSEAQKQELLNYYKSKQAQVVRK